MYRNMQEYSDFLGNLLNKLFKTNPAPVGKNKAKTNLQQTMTRHQKDQKEDIRFFLYVILITINVLLLKF